MTRAKELSRSADGLKSAINNEDDENNSNTFRRVHWRDCLHEPDGTEPALIITSEGERDLDRVKRQVDGLCEPVPKIIQPSARETSKDMFFRQGENAGAAILDKHLAALSNRDGRTFCVDDVSGEMLSEEGVREARALEMEYFIKMGVYSYVTREEAARSGKGKIIKLSLIHI